MPLYVHPRRALGTPPGRAAPTLLRGRPWPDTYPSASFLMFIGTKSGVANPAIPSIWAFGDFSGAKRPPRPPARHPPKSHLTGPFLHELAPRPHAGQRGRCFATAPHYISIGELRARTAPAWRVMPLPGRLMPGGALRSAQPSGTASVGEGSGSALFVRQPSIKNG